MADNSLLKVLIINEDKVADKSLIIVFIINEDKVADKGCNSLLVVLVIKAK